jgi:hypothetical protein
MTENFFRQNMINIIEQAFNNMKERKETFAFVKLFSFDTPKTIILPRGEKLRANYIRILLIRNDVQENLIKFFYRDKRSKLFMLRSLEEKQIAVDFFKANDILPNEQEFSEACSLLNIPGAVDNIVGCDFENAITEHAKAFLENNKKT